MFLRILLPSSSGQAKESCKKKWLLCTRKKWVRQFAKQPTEVEWSKPWIQHARGKQHKNEIVGGQTKTK